MIGVKAHNVFSRGDETFLMLGIEGLGTYERAMIVLTAIRAVVAREERRRRRGTRLGRLKRKSARKKRL